MFNLRIVYIQFAFQTQCVYEAYGREEIRVRAELKQRRDEVSRGGGEGRLKRGCR